MPPTTIVGVIGAILGLEKNEDVYYKTLTSKGIRVGIGLDAPVKKYILSTNLINTKGDYWVPTRKNSNGSRTPTRFEYVKEAQYTIYVSMNDETMLDELAARVRKHCLAYTISLGLAGLLGDVKFLSYEEAEYIQSEEYVAMDSAVPIRDLCVEKAINMKSEVQYCKEEYVECFANDRVPKRYVEVLFASNAVKMLMKIKGFYKMGDKNFVFLNNNLL
jgi:CRISPR-associated protein Cas5h